MGVGRKKKFTPDSLQKKVNEFYEHCQLTGEVMTIERLASFIEVDRKTLWTYEKTEPELAAVVLDAKRKIIAEMVTKGLMGEVNPTFGIFVLKQYGYSDKVETHNTNENTNKNYDLTNLSTEKIKELLNNEA